jgi:serine/threonine-protein kinase
MAGKEPTTEHDNPPVAVELIAGRYRLLEPLGRGAMSSVWLAQDEELQRRVAVKMLAPNADRARFEREARAAAALSHPNICSLYDFGEAGGLPYMVLEYLPNGSLEERLKSGPLPDAEALRLATEIAAGLAHAHERGLVHRDLKPANVLFDVEDRAKIADFGIARMGGSGTLTEAGTVLGTASYISPEQASGHAAGPESDVYSFGVILFRMLTGRLPFVSTNAMELVRMHRDDQPPAVADFRGDAPARLESLAAAALAKDPAGRPADGSALVRELRGGGGGGEGEDATMMLAPGAFPAAPGAFPAASAATQVLRPVQPPRQRREPEFWLVPLVLVLLGGGVALALLTTSGGGGTQTTNPLPSLGLPSVPTAGSTKPATGASTTAPTTTAQTTAHRVTTVPVTPTVLPTTTVAPPPTTTVTPPPTTTAPTPATTDTTATTTPTPTTTSP